MDEKKEKNEKKVKEEKKEKKPRFSFTKKKETNPEKEIVKKINRDPYEVLRFVLMTEKAVRMIELQNKLVFIVNRRSDKTEIKSSVEAAFNSPVRGVETAIDQEGRKKAYIKFKNAGAAGDIAVRLGII